MKNSTFLHVPGDNGAMRKGAIFLCLVLALALLPAGSALAGKKVTIKGGGWGHGIGMSQYGAYGRALNGKSGIEIVKKYYTGARVKSMDMPSALRVGLLQTRTSMSFTSSAFKDGGGEVRFKVKGTPGRIARGGAGTNWRVDLSGTGGMKLFKNGRRVRKDGKSVFGSASKPLVIKYEKFGTLLRVEQKSNNYAYGQMEVGTYRSSSCGGRFCMNLVVALPMQKYLYGLGEVPSSWPKGALEAQAIAGRTYAFKKALDGQNRAGCSCAVYDSTIDQAYVGDAKRTGSGSYWKNWKAAVNDTNKRVAVHKGAPISALYSSSSGGHTENNENVWGGAPFPYLRGVNDAPDDVSANPNHTWKVTMSWGSFRDKLEAAYDIGRLKRFKLKKPFGVSGRVTVVKENGRGGAAVVGSQDTARVSGWSLRTVLGLKDTLFRVTVTHTVAREMQAKYDSLDAAPGEALTPGYRVPKGDSGSLGKAQNFEVGRMTFNEANGKVTWQHGAVLERYDAAGREASRLGMPKSSIWGPGTFLGATYGNGTIVWTEAHGAKIVLGVFSKAHRALGGAGGILGAPKTDRKSNSLTPGGVNKLQRFVGGTIYKSAAGAFGIPDPIDRRYRKMGGGTSPCGYPTARYKDGVATFQNGTITASDEGVTVDC